MANKSIEKSIKSELDLINRYMKRVEKIKPGRKYKYNLMCNRNDVELLKDVIIQVRANVSAIEFKSIKARFDKVLEKMKVITADSVENNVDDVIKYLTVSGLAKHKKLSDLFTWKETIYFINERLDQQTIRELTNDDIFALCQATNVLSSCVKKEKADMFIEQMIDNFKAWSESTNLSQEARELIVRYKISAINDKTYLSKYFKKKAIERLTAINLLYQMK